MKVLATYADLTVNRCYFSFDVNDPLESIHLHGFSDTAKKSFSACIYIQGITKSGNIKVSLVAAKSRVKPIKKELTMPKLELPGNLILAQLMKTVYNALKNLRRYAIKLIAVIRMSP